MKIKQRRTSPYEEWFGPGFGWSTPRKIAEWFDKEYDKYCDGKSKLKMAAAIRFDGLLRYEARLDCTIDRLTNG